MKAAILSAPTGRFARHSTNRSFRPGTTHVITGALDGAVSRVRLHQERSSNGNYNGRPIQTTKTTYLDGTVVTEHVFDGAPPQIERTTMAASAIPVRSKDVVDFGRLRSAVTTLTQQMASYDVEADPDGEQLQAFLRSYQGILAWQEKAKVAMAEADGQIDVAAALLRRAMGVG